KGFPPLTTPTKKTCKKNRTHVHPRPNMDSSLHLVPGRLQAAHCSWGVLAEGRSRMGKKQKINSPRPQAYLRVCVLCRLHVCTCVFQCVVCAIKNLTKVLIIMCLSH